MRLDKYIPEGKYYKNFSDIRQVGVARVLLEAAEIKRDEIRQQTESKPQFSPEDLKKDIVFLTGAIWAFNWIINLPDEARKVIARLPEE